MAASRFSYESIHAWAVRNRIHYRLSVALAIASLISVLATYIVLVHAPPFAHNKKLLIVLLNLDLIFLLSLGGLIARRLVKLWAERRSGRAGSKLHSRMVGVFSLVAIVPTVCVSIFSALFFNVAVQSWFSERVETAIGESTSIAKAYLQEHEQVIGANAQALAYELQNYLLHNPSAEEDLNALLTHQARLRSLDEAALFDSTMDIIGQSRFSFSIMFERITGEDLLKSANQPVIYTNDRHDRVRALIQVDPKKGLYLLVGRNVSPRVLERVDKAEKAAYEYNALEKEGSTLAIRFAMIFIGISLVLLLLVIWGGLVFANRLMHPIAQLITAAQDVTNGKLSTRIRNDGDHAELSSLIRAFNRMTKQLESQRHELEETNEQLDHGLRFMEAVLGGVSAGVIGLDSLGRIQIPNQSASDLLEIDLDAKIGKKLRTTVPEMAELFDEAKSMASDSYLESEILMNRDGHDRTFLVRITIERNGKKVDGFVVTFDDITELQTAQRTAAWTDVARRIAHEIKNPLTPIQLSAERLKRKYERHIQDDPETFIRCINTIIRQVEHLGIMVNEFSSFSRLPQPKMQHQDIVALCHESIFLQQQSHIDIPIHMESNVKELVLPCDGRQLQQVITNLIKNAQEAVDNVSTDKSKKEILVKMTKSEDHVILTVEDSGKGFPATGREKLAEPYITHREKGTGLGLAIVKKIIEDHGGELQLSDSIALGGAKVAVVLDIMWLKNKTANGDDPNGTRHSRY